MNEHSSGEFKYWAFISYSQKDRRWGEWVHRNLESYRVPKKLVGRHTLGGPIPKSFRPIFRDRDELPASSDLSTALKEALRLSSNLIVICSPDSARSRWVNEEILTFKRLGREDRILCLIVRGEPFASESDGASSQECFAPALLTNLGPDGQPANGRIEPMAADIRGGGDGKAHARLKLAAGIAGVGFDELRRRDRARRRRRYMILAAVAMLLIVPPVHLILQSPPAAWMPAEFDGSNIVKAGFINKPDGSETVRLLLSGEIVGAMEESRATKHVVLDLDNQGRIAGELAYIDNNGTVEQKLANEKTFATLGTLEDEQRIFEDLFSVNRYYGPAASDIPVFLFRDSPSRVGSETKSLSPAKWPDVVEDSKLNFLDRLKEKARSTLGDARFISESHDYAVFRLDSARLLAFVRVQLPGKRHFGEQSLGSRSFRSDDEGQNWEAGDTTQIVVSGITAVAKASPDGRDLYLSSFDTVLSEDYAGGRGAIFRSSNGGISWGQVTLPPSWNDWRSFSGVAASLKHPGTIAIAISWQQGIGPKRPGTPGVLLSTDAGSSWKLLIEGIASPGDGQIQLLGIGKSNNVFALMEDLPRYSGSLPNDRGRLIIWRKLSLLERLQGKYGISH